MTNPQPTHEMIAMAKELVKRFYPEMRPSYDGRHYQIALVAIIETQELCAKLAMDHSPERVPTVASASARATARAIATAIRAGEFLR
jgi:hypothetical protein